MQITARTWNEYIARLSKLNEKAGQLMQEYVAAHGIEDGPALIAYAHALVTKYGEGSAELACQMYDALAEASKTNVPAAEPAATANYGEVARMVNATKRQNPANLPNGVRRLVKRAGADTTLHNAIRDGAEWAWVPHGDTCPFCIMLASNGWQKASAKLLKGGHAEHIHANCDCEFAVRFDGSTSVAGYDPEKYLRQYRAAGSDVNAMRRIDYAARKDAINAQKRAAWAVRKGYANDTKDAIIIEKLRTAAKLPNTAVIHLKPTPIDVDSLTFDDTHVNKQRSHNVSEEQAKQYIRDAKISVTVWNGQFERYYGTDGTAYVSIPQKEIRTAYSSVEYTDKLKALIEEMKNNGILG